MALVDGNGYFLVVVWVVLLSYLVEFVFEIKVEFGSGILFLDQGRVVDIDVVFI